MPLLGKISAVLSANTQDFTRGLRQAGADLQAFQRTSQGFRLNLDRDSLDRTLTRLQVFQRQMQEVRRQIEADGSLRMSLPNPERMLAQFRLFQDVGRPVTDLKNKVEALSTTLQAGLYPELGKIQAGFQGVYQAISRGPQRLAELRRSYAELTEQLSRTTDATQATALRGQIAGVSSEMASLRKAMDLGNQQRTVDSLTAALQRLGRTAAAAGDIGGLTKALDATGVGASFTQPRLKSALKETKSLRGEAEGLPGQLRGVVFQRLSEEAEANAQAVEAQLAKIQRLESMLARDSGKKKRDPRIAVALDNEQVRLNRLTQNQEAINAQFRREIAVSEVADFARGPKESQAELLKKRYESLGVTLRELGGTRFDPLIRSVGEVVRQLLDGEIAAGKARKAIESLSTAARTQRVVSKMEDKAAGVLVDPDLATRSSILDDAARQRLALSRDTKLPDGKRDRVAEFINIRESAALEREEFTREFLPRIAELQKTSESAGDIGFSKRVDRLRRQALVLNNDLRTAFASGDINAATNALKAYGEKMAAILPKLQQAEKAAKAFSGAAKQVDMFRTASGSRGDKLDPVLERAASSIMVARQFRGQYAEGNDVGRIRAGDAINAAEGKIEQLTRIRARVESTNNPKITEEEKIRRYKGINAEIEKQIKLLLELIATESRGVFSQSRVKAAAKLAAKNTGSFAIAGAASAQLAVQQGIFAFDDLMSATGGVEYKLRAVGNNISQFGLLLGQSGMIPGLKATTGLFLGMSVVLGSHVAIALGKALFNFDEAEEKIKSLNETLSKSRESANHAASAYRSLAAAIRESAAQGAYASRGGLDARLREARESTRKEQEDYLAARSPGLAEAAARRAVIEKRLSEATQLGERARLLVDLNKATADERSVRKGLLSGALERPEAARESDRERAADLKRQMDNIPGGDFTRMASGFGDFIVEQTNLLDLWNPRLSKEARKYRQLAKELAEVSERLAKDQAVSGTSTYRTISRIGDRGAASAMAASSSIGAIESSVDADIRGRISSIAKKAADAMATAIEKASEAAREDRPDDARDQIAKARASLRQLNKITDIADRMADEAKLGGSVTTQSRLSSAASMAGEGPSRIGTQAARAKVELESAERARNRAVLADDYFGVRRADARIEAIREFAKSLEQGAIAVASFNRAAETAAASLSRTLVQEAQSELAQARRRTNRLSGDPLDGGQARADEFRAEMRQAERERANRDLETTLAAERNAVTAEIESGRNPEAKKLVEEIQSMRDVANDKTDRYTDAQRENARARAARAQADLDAMFEARPGVAAARRKVDEIDAAEQRRREEERRAREVVERRASFGDANRSAARRLFSQVGNVEGLLGVENTDRQMQEISRRIRETPAEATLSAALKKELEKLVLLSGKQRDEALRLVIDRELQAGASFEAQAKATRGNVGGMVTGLTAPLTEMELRRKDLEGRRDEAAKAGLDDQARAFQAEIDAMDNMVANLNAASIAVAGFQAAMEKAAMSLQETVRGEAESMATDARRRANEAESRFGAKSPEAKEARERQARLEKAATAAQDARDKAAETVAAERVQFEKEIREGRNPAAAARAERIRELEQKVADEKLTPEQRAAAAAEAQRLRREQEREFEQRPGVQGARREADKADAELQRQRSIDRGRELSRDPEDRRKREVAEQSADIGAYIKDLMDNGMNRRMALDEANKAARQLAVQAAPLYAQFGDELANARLQGPSRAALKVQDISTMEGASELNRLLRGDDDAKNVNLVEMKRQTQLLEEIEDTLRNTTGLPVAL